MEERERERTSFRPFNPNLARVRLNEKSINRTRENVRDVLKLMRKNHAGKKKKISNVERNIYKKKLRDQEYTASARSSLITARLSLSFFSFTLSALGAYDCSLLFVVVFSFFLSSSSLRYVALSLGYGFQLKRD